MDTMLHVEPGQKIPKLNEKTRSVLISTIKTLVVKLLEKSRKSIAKQYAEHTEWGSTDEKDIIRKADIYKKRAIYPFHEIIKIEQPSREELEMLRKHNAELHNMKMM